MYYLLLKRDPNPIFFNPVFNPLSPPAPTPKASPVKNRKSKKRGFILFSSLAY